MHVMHKHDLIRPTRQHNAATERPDWLRKGQCLAKRSFWSRLGVFEEPGHPLGPHPALPPPPLSLNLFGIWMFVWWKFPFCSPFTRHNRSIFASVSSRWQLVDCVGACACVCCAPVRACVCAGTCVFLTQPVFGAESAPDATQKDNERAGTVAAGSWAATQSDPGGAALVCV